MARRIIDHDAAKERLLSALRAGNTRRASCGYAGISEDTLARWLKNAEFADSIEKAEADAEVRAVAQVAKAAGEGSWQAAAWWLERRRHEEWKRREQYDFRKLSDEELIREAKSLFGGDLSPATGHPQPGEGSQQLPD